MSKNHNRREIEKTIGVPVETPVQEEIMTEGETETPVVETPVVEKKTVMGVVVDCIKLRVRKAPTTSAIVLCEIDCGAEVAIDEKKSNKEFFKVCTEAGVDGYCMKKFIKVN